MADIIGPPADAVRNRSINAKLRTLLERAGLSDEFGVVETLPVGTEVTVSVFEGPNKEWAIVDKDGDNVPDSNVRSTSLAPRKVQEDQAEEVGV